MRLLDKGKYDIDEGSLLIQAESEEGHYMVLLSKDVLENQFNATSSGHFHEYWARVLEHRDVLEKVAGSKVKSGEVDESGTIEILNSDFE